MRVLVIASLVFGLSMMSASLVQAQSTRRPDLNIFKRALRDPAQSLAVNGMLGGSWYHSLTRQLLLPSDDFQVPSSSGWGALASASLQYRVRLGQLSLDGSVGSYLSYYPELAKPFQARWFPSGGAATGYGWQLGRKTTLDVSGGVRYQPIYLETLSFFNRPGLGGGASTDPGSSNNFLPPEALSVDGSLLATNVRSALRHQLSRRWSVTADYGYGRDYALGVEEDNPYQDLWRQDAGTAVHYQVTQRLSVRGGYRYSESHGDGAEYKTHTADVGVDYGDGLTLQLARDTRLTLRGGFSGYVDRTGSQRYTVVGDVRLSHSMGRTWLAEAYYNRSVDSSQLIFTAPMLSDSAGATLTGLLTRRTGFHASLETQGGTLAFGSSDSDLLRLAFNAGIQRAISRNLAFGVDYSYYKYSYDEGVPLPRGLTNEGATQGIYVHLDAWAPIFQRGGRSNVTR